MDIGLIIVLLHVLTAGWFVGGLVGRNVTFGYARAATKLETTIALLRASEHFERRMVMPGSMMILLLGLIAAWLRGWPILGFLQGGSSNWVLASLIIYLGLVPFIPLTVAPRRKAREGLVEAPSPREGSPSSSPPRSTTRPCFAIERPRCWSFW